MSISLLFRSEVYFLRLRLIYGIVSVSQFQLGVNILSAFNQSFGCGENDRDYKIDVFCELKYYHKNLFIFSLLPYIDFLEIINSLQR
jgi:hypothetical protein